jgi:hypothetical protein
MKKKSKIIKARGFVFCYFSWMKHGKMGVEPIEVDELWMDRGCAVGEGDRIMSNHHFFPSFSIFFSPFLSYKRIRTPTRTPTPTPTFLKDSYDESKSLSAH